MKPSGYTPNTSTNDVALPIGEGRGLKRKLLIEFLVLAASPFPSGRGVG